FIMIGFTATLISDFFMMYQDIIRQIGAILIIFFGLVIVGVFNFKFLMKNKQLTFKNRPTGYIGSFFIGMAFSMGWTRCMGPSLAVVVFLEADTPVTSVVVIVSLLV